jgi:phage shock protein E
MMSYNRRILLSLVMLVGGWCCLAYSAATDASISQQELVERLQTRAEMLVLDVRTAREFHTGHVPGAINIPHTELPKRLAEVVEFKNKEVVIYCERGGRADTATQVLREAGFASIRHLQGDMAAWRARALPMATPSSRP